MIFHQLTTKTNSIVIFKDNDDYPIAEIIKSGPTQYYVDFLNKKKKSENMVLTANNISDILEDRRFLKEIT